MTTSDRVAPTDLGHVTALRTRPITAPLPRPWGPDVPALHLVEVTVEGAPAWVVGEPEPGGPSGVTLVPGFDEWILGYADRSLVASPAALARLVPGGNGVFRPAVLVDGVVVGTWRPAPPSRPTARVVLELVERVPPAVSRAIDRALADWPHG